MIKKSILVIIMITTAIYMIGCSSLPHSNPLESADLTAPSVPSGLAATKRNGQVSLSWTANSEGDLAGYNVYSDSTSWSDYYCVKVNSSLVTANSYTDTPSNSYSTWLYKITAVDTSGNESSKSSLCTPTTDTTAPAAPTGLTGTAGDSKVTLSWTANTESDLSGYNVYLIGSYSDTKQNTSVITITSSIISSLTDGTSYTFKIKAIDTSDNASAYSSSVTCTPTDGIAPSAPSGLAATPPYSSIYEIDLSWYVNTESDLAGYNIYRSSSSGGTYGRINSTIVSKTSTSYDNGGLADGTYYYKITAVDASGNESTYSNVASSHSHE